MRTRERRRHQTQHARRLHQRALRLEEDRKYDDALACQLKAITFAPWRTRLHVDLGQFLLRRGEFGPGLREFDWHWRLRHKDHQLPRFPVPRWNGMTLRHGRILLVDDQGAGDAIQFARYIPLVAERCRKIVVAAPPGTARLFKTFSGGVRVVTRYEDAPSYDVFCPLSALSLVLGTTLETIPDTVPYLVADGRKASAWNRRLATETPPGQLRVGIAWAGNPAYARDRWRSTRLAEWQLILNVAGVSFVSLQKHVREEDRAALKANHRLIDLTDRLHDFSDAAALTDHLDLVISVDTSAIHLAGAMGKPGWLLLPWLADPRWLLERDDSPWYPTVRLFRQATRDQWDDVIQTVAERLRRLAAEHRPRG